MNLQSPSGYAMPFELTESEPLEIIKEYGGSEMTSIMVLTLKCVQTHGLKLSQQV